MRDQGRPVKHSYLDWHWAEGMNIKDQTLSDTSLLCNSPHHQSQEFTNHIDGADMLPNVDRAMIRLSPLSLNWLENIARQHISLMKLFFWKYLLQQRRNIFIFDSTIREGSPNWHRPCLSRQSQQHLHQHRHRVAHWTKTKTKKSKKM